MVKTALTLTLRRRPEALRLERRGVYTICASLVCDDSNQVLDGDDNPIEGLYAAGNAGGSFFGYYCPVSGFSAAGVSHALVGGPLAAASALGKTLDDLPKA